MRLSRHFIDADCGGDDDGGDAAGFPRERPRHRRDLLPGPGDDGDTDVHVPLVGDTRSIRPGRDRLVVSVRLGEGGSRQQTAARCG